MLLALLLPACSPLALPQKQMPAAGPNASYEKLIASEINSLFKDRASYQAFEISRARWVHAIKGWSWRTCVRFQDHGNRRTYTLFIKDGVVIDNRYAVETDGCNGETYAPFDPATGTLRPVSFGAQKPIY